MTFGEVFPEIIDGLGNLDNEILADKGSPSRSLSKRFESLGHQTFDQGLSGRFVVCRSHGIKIVNPLEIGKRIVLGGIVVGGIVSLIPRGLVDHGEDPVNQQKPNDQEDRSHRQIGNVRTPKFPHFGFHGVAVNDHGLVIGHFGFLVVLDVVEDVVEFAVVAVDDFQIIPQKLPEGISHESAASVAVAGIGGRIDVDIALGALCDGEGLQGLAEKLQGLEVEVERGFGLSRGFDVVYGGLVHGIKIVN